VQYVPSPQANEIQLWDTRTGDLYTYYLGGRIFLQEHLRVKALGQEIEILCSTQGECARQMNH